MFRRIPAILLLAVASQSSCATVAENTQSASASTSHVYLTTFATSFVDVLRTGGAQAGAFEMTRRPEKDGLHHLQVELWDADQVQSLDVGLQAVSGGLSMTTADLDGQDVFATGDSLGSTLLECRRHADRLSREEDGQAPSMIHVLDVDFTSHGRRSVRIDDLLVSQEPGAYDDLQFRTDSAGPELASLHHRNLMRLGIGSEEAFRRLVLAFDWTSEDLTQSVQAAGIAIDNESNTGYWAPLSNVPVSVGSIFAVRSRLSSRPTALIFVRASSASGVGLQVVHSPLPTSSH